MDTVTEEVSLRRYLESQRIDPVQQQLNLIHLQMVNDKKSRAPDHQEIYEVKQRLQRVPRIGVDTKFFKPAILVHETVAYIKPIQIGDELYEKHTMRKKGHIHPLPGTKMSFTPPGRIPTSESYLHRYSTSMGDQMALKEFRRKQLSEEEAQFNKLAKLKPAYIEKLGLHNDTNRSAVLHDPLSVTVVLSNDPWGRLQPPADILSLSDPWGRLRPPSPTSTTSSSPRSNASLSPTDPMHTLRDLTWTPGRSRSSPPNLVSSSPEESPYEGLPHKRKAAPEKIFAKLREAVMESNTKFKKAYQNITTDRMIEAITNHYTDLDEDEKLALQNITRKVELSPWFQRKARRESLSPVRPRFLPGASSSSAPPLETSEPTKFARGRSKGRTIYKYLWNEHVKLWFIL